jgi:hypothetical protein
MKIVTAGWILSISLYINKKIRSHDDMSKRTQGEPIRDDMAKMAFF